MEKRDYKEYWLQTYIATHPERFGISKLEGPFEVGPDFKGIYKRKQVVIEAERYPANFVKHGHDVKTIDVLIILVDDDTPRELLPPVILIADFAHFEDVVAPLRKAYAIKKTGQREREDKMMPFYMLRSAFYSLYTLHADETVVEASLEADALSEAAERTALEYLDLYKIKIADLGGNYFTRIEILINDLLKSRRRLTSEETQFLQYWFDMLVENLPTL